MPYLRHTFTQASFVTVLASASVGCGNTANAPKTAGPRVASANAGLAFTGGDAQYSSSTLYFYDFSTGAIRPLLSGESGDPICFWQDSALFFFNRKGDNSNFRHLNPRADSVQPSTQLKTPAAGVGDPHDVLSLGSNHLLLAEWASGKLEVVDQNSGATVQEITADWDLPAGAPLRPNAFYRYTGSDGTTRIFVLHQGLGADYKANGSQQVFVLIQTPNGLIVEDQDLATPHVQGIKLFASSPQAFLNTASGEPLLLGMCTTYLGDGCKAAVERLNPGKRSVETLWDLTQSGYQYNGQEADGPDANSVFANVSMANGSAAPHLNVVKIDAAAKSITPVHTFAASQIGGAYGLFYDTQAKTLYVGDARDTNSGKFTIYRDGSSPTELDVPVIPYNGVFIPAASP